MDKSAPRYSAGSMSLPEGAGEITSMCSCGEFMEIYTETATYKVRSPKTIDPELTNPNAPWVSSKSSEFGSSSDIVARVLLQGSDMINAAALPVSETEKARMIKHLHNSKEALLACEKVRLRVTESAESIIQSILSEGIDLEHGRHVKNLPQVPNLDEDSTSFLINMKRAIVSTCYLASVMLPLTKKDNNLEHLKKSVEKLNDEKYSKLLDSIEEFIPAAKHLVELRNFQEHPDTKTTFVENFTITPQNEIGYPVWYVSGNPPNSIIAAMKAAIDFGIVFTETMLIHYLFASMESRFPYYIEVVPEEKIDRKTPIRYRLSIDIGSIHFGE
jgi:hypothetical protein